MDKLFTFSSLGAYIFLFHCQTNYILCIFQVTTKRDRHYAHGPPFDTISGVGRMQVVGRVLENF